MFVADTNDMSYTAMFAVNRSITGRCLYATFANLTFAAWPHCSSSSLRDCIRYMKTKLQSWRRTRRYHYPHKAGRSYRAGAIMSGGKDGERRAHNGRCKTGRHISASSDVDGSRVSPRCLFVSLMTSVISHCTSVCLSALRI